MQNILRSSAIFLGLASAIRWGAGDFSGGFITKLVNVFHFAIISQAFGALFVLGLALLFREQKPLPTDVEFGAAACVAGSRTLIIIYRALAFDRTAVVAPIAAAVMAGLPLFSLHSLKDCQVSIKCTDSC